jgi:hypothetical protein
MDSLERKSDKEDIKECFHCKQIIKNECYILIKNAFYFHKPCIDYVLFKKIELKF